MKRFGRALRRPFIGTRTHALVLPTTLLLIAATVFAGRVWWTKGESSSEQREAELRSTIANDPALGSRIVLPTSFPNSEEGVIVICATLCDCNVAQLEVLMQLSAESVPVCVVSPVDESAFQAAPAMQRFRKLFYLDPSFRVVEKLNAMFMPRAYRLSKNRRLIWKSEHYEPSWKKLIEEAETVLGAKGRNK